MTPAGGVWTRPDLPRPWRCELAVLDVDGVLIDVQGSFREAVRLSVERVQRLLGVARPWVPTQGDIRRLKAAGGFNDDVDTAVALCAVGSAGRQAGLDSLLRAVETAGGGLGGLERVAPELPRIPARLVLRVFDEHYWGADAFRARFGAAPEHDPSRAGLRATERALVPPDFVARLRRAGLDGVALISGRSPLELDAALELLGWERSDLAAVVGGDAVRKPDPACVDAVVAATGARSLIYAGDVRDDWELVRRYRAERDAAVELLGVAVGAEAPALRALGCDATLDRVTALPALLCQLATAP